MSYGDWQFGHDELRHCRSLDDVRSWLAQPCTGTVETAAAPFWRLLPEHVTAAVIRRPLNEVMASLWRGGMQFDVVTMARHLAAQDAKLRQFAHRRPGVLCTTFAELGTEEGCARVFEHCLPYRHDHSWWAALDKMNLQVSLPHARNYFLAHAQQLEKLRKTARHRCIANMARAYGEIEGVTFRADEEFWPFFNDAKACFAEHLVQTDQPPDEYDHKNLPLLERMHQLGRLQIVSARSNGRLFGYLVTVIAPSLDDETQQQAWHTIFFAFPAIKGLGMKLQRFALEALRERGVNEVVMRAGHRGSGPRLGTFYRRLGAEEFGQLYRLELEN